MAIAYIRFDTWNCRCTKNDIVVFWQRNLHMRFASFDLSCYPGFFLTFDPSIVKSPCIRALTPVEVNESIERLSGVMMPQMWIVGRFELRLQRSHHRGPSMLRTTQRALHLSRPCRETQYIAKRYSSSPATASQPATSPFAPRHFLSIADLTPAELTTLVRNAASHKTAVKSGHMPAALENTLLGKCVALTFSKRSTRTRVSTEAAVALMAGHPMFLGKEDIQLGVNESLYDTSVVISSMVSCIVARVNGHSDVAELAKHSSVPVINALSDLYHPLQTIADFLTVHEAFPSRTKSSKTLGLEGMKIAWVGDANNVLFDLAIGAMKLGVDVAVATPKGYEIPSDMREVIKSAAATAPHAGSLSETLVPEEAVKNADIIVTDTWVSMGQEEEKIKRLKAFEGFQVSRELADRGGANEGWRFMHCLPRHQEEVSDEIFYGPKSLVFPEAENRLWSAVASQDTDCKTAALEAFVVNKGKIC
ncbi:hypothetical protein BT93_L4562 [Corymbia citriodora subsp. variegata]|uniref:ornithine carbamoyltransferase n=1 Tax=Corymbia citriodora subsp. variegata TaxID=360336 RepID=A0A8T0CFN6_CORYI|nr:hypothetical protein BT93_L4562 [Corymbia citriodora subsp. variegata]